MSPATYRKYTKERLEPLIKKNVSVAGVMRDLGLTVLQGGSHTYISRVIQNFGIDTTHFTGQASNQGNAHRGGPEKKSAKKILILRESGKRQKAYQLRRALIESSRPYKCANCGLSGEWQSKPLMLEVDHKNGNCLDDRAENLLFLCPNCHSQTMGHCGSKGYAEVTSTAKYTKDYKKRKKENTTRSKTSI